MKVAFYTLGCKVNQYETNAMSQAFIEAGHSITDFEQEAEGRREGESMYRSGLNSKLVSISLTGQCISWAIFLKTTGFIWGIRN